MDSINIDLDGFDPSEDKADDELDLSEFLYLSTKPKLHHHHHHHQHAHQAHQSHLSPFAGASGAEAASAAPSSSSVVVGAGTGASRAHEFNYNSSESDNSDSSGSDADDEDYFDSDSSTSSNGSGGSGGGPATPASFPFYSTPHGSGASKFVTPTRRAALSPATLKLAHVYERIYLAAHRDAFKQRRACTVVVVGASGNDPMMLYLAKLLLDEKEAAHVWLLASGVAAFADMYGFLTIASTLASSAVATESALAAMSLAPTPIKTRGLAATTIVAADTAPSKPDGATAILDLNADVVSANSSVATLQRAASPSAATPPVRIVGGVPIMRIALPNEIVDSFLFLGSDRHARDATALRNLKITHILNCAHDCENHFELRPNAELPRLHYLHLDARDAPTERISAHFQQSFEFIEYARQSKGRILVHCAQGISRSATVVIGYLMATRKWILKQAFDLVRSRRTVICPNMGFFFQLGELELALGFGESTLKKCLPQVDLKLEYSRLQEMISRQEKTPATASSSTATPTRTSTPSAPAPKSVPSSAPSVVSKKADGCLVM